MRLKRVNACSKEDFEISRHRANHFSVPDVTCTIKEPENKNEGYTEFKRRIINSESEKRFNNFDEYENTISLSDFCWYFNFKAKQKNDKYVFLNDREAKKHFKTLRKTYTNRDIKDMIDFIFDSNQNYIMTKSITPRILISQWANKIYSDSQLWRNDEYVPKKRVDEIVDEREWDKEIKKSKVGKW